jgi:hypothetical protein
MDETKGLVGSILKLLNIFFQKSTKKLRKNWTMISNYYQFIHHNSNVTPSNVSNRHNQQLVVFVFGILFFPQFDVFNYSSACFISNATPAADTATVVKSTTTNQL